MSRPAPRLPARFGPALRGCSLRSHPLRFGPNLAGRELDYPMQRCRTDAQSVKDVAGLKCKGCSARTTSPPLRSGAKAAR
jgi:hypothetical protein